MKAADTSAEFRMLFQRKPTANPTSQNNTLVYCTQEQTNLKPNGHDSVYCCSVHEEKHNKQRPV